MEFVLLWLVFAVVVGIGAGARGRSGFGWFLLACFFSPLLMVLLLVLLPSLNQAKVATPVAQASDAVGPSTHRRCPECAEWVLKEARKCKHCGSAIAAEQPVSPQRLSVTYDEADLADVPVSGTKDFQTTLTEIAGRTAIHSLDKLRAQLVRDSNNKFDRNAVRVEIEGKPVGFLPVSVAAEFEANLRRHYKVTADELPPMTVPAIISLQSSAGGMGVTVRLPAAIARGIPSGASYA